MDTGQLLTLLVATGVLTAIGEIVRWYLGRGKGKVDSAKVVQGMALDMLKPLHDELANTAAEVTLLRDTTRHLTMQMEAVLVWAVSVVAILDSNGISYPQVPEPVRARINPED